MKEILGGNLEHCFKELSVNAKKTYHLDDDRHNYEVWELSDIDFDIINSVTEADWKDNWGWWRSSESSNMGIVNRRFKINNCYIKAWDGAFREDEIEDNKNERVVDRIYTSRTYSSLLEYFCEEIGASTERNVCALAIDLAKQNGITMGELFKKYQG